MAEPLPLAITTQNKGPMTVVAICTITALVTLFVFARLYVRAKIMREVHYDDFLIAFSMVCSTLML